MNYHEFNIRQRQNSLVVYSRYKWKFLAFYLIHSRLVGRVQKNLLLVKKNEWKLPFLIIKTYSTPKNTYENI